MGHDESYQFPTAGQFIIRTPLERTIFFNEFHFISTELLSRLILCQRKSLVEIISTNKNKFYLALGSDRLQRGRALQLHSVLIGCTEISRGIDVNDVLFTFPESQ